MPESLQTFINIFQGNVKKIVIPKIQRDYAQGRNTEEIRRVRSKFLDALYKAMTNDEKIKLDFVYGGPGRRRNFNAARRPATTHDTFPFALVRRKKRKRCARRNFFP